MKGSTVLVLMALLPSPVAAQSEAPPGPYAVDIRGAIGSLPQDASFFPPAPTGTSISTGGAGFDIGGHVYLIQLGPARIGLGMDLFRVGKKSSPRTESTSGNEPARPPTVPSVTTRVRMIAPQLSFNFGSSRGWSYISAGVGQITVSTATSEFPIGSSSTAATMPARTRDTAALQTINVGGGARWFDTEHLAFSFDVRIHKARGRSKEGVSTMPVTLVTAAAGISLK